MWTIINALKKNRLFNAMRCYIKNRYANIQNKTFSQVLIRFIEKFKISNVEKRIKNFM